jgi:hypothetical protein
VWFCGGSQAGIAGSNPVVGMVIRARMSFFSVVFCQVEASASAF